MMKFLSVFSHLYLAKHCTDVLLSGVLFFFLLSSGACSDRPEHAENIQQLPPIYPDYIGVTIPAGIAPLNFNYAGGDFDRMYVVVKGAKGDSITTSGDFADFDIDEWHELTKRNKGAALSVSVSVEKQGQWYRYRDFQITVSPYDLKAYGLTYRRIAPGYEVYSKMGIYQRNLSDFQESAIMENTAVPGACMNCHTSNRTNPSQFTFHIRGSHGATLIDMDGKRAWLKAKNDSLGGSLVYPYWHPSGNWCAFSTNNTRQGFHSMPKERIEVFDLSSDVIVYQPKTHQIYHYPQLATKNHFETYPAFSPDGRTLYFCSADSVPIPQRYRDVRYSLCRVSFDAKTGRIGDKVDTLVSASTLGKSVTFPRPSYDGRYILVTLSDYGCFPIWHKEADLALLDLKTGKVRIAKELNSRQTDSFHNWSADSHWIVFSSRRGDGLYTRLYLASVDGQGHFSKPFLLPQRNPWKYYDESVYSYNVPDFTLAPVDFNLRKAAREISSDKREPTELLRMKN